MIHRSLAQRPSAPVSHQPTISKKVLLEPGELPVLTNFSQAVFKPGDIAPSHHHGDMWEVFFVRSGGGVIRVDGLESPLVEDECWVIEPGETHEIANDTEGDLVLLYFGLSPSAAPEGTASSSSQVGGNR